MLTLRAGFNTSSSDKNSGVNSEEKDYDDLPF
jgi:hypothetical protein